MPYVVKVYGWPMGLRVSNLLRENVKALLRARHDTQRGLAFALGKHPTWINKFLLGKRNIRMEDLDSLSDYFGLSTYQLLQPGIGALTERRKGTERRTVKDRRMGHAHRDMLAVAAELMAVRPPGKANPHATSTAHRPTLSPATADAIRAVMATAEEQVSRLIALENPGEQAQTPGGRLARPRPRRRAVRGSDPQAG